MLFVDGIWEVIVLEMVKALLQLLLDSEFGPSFGGTFLLCNC